MSEQPGVPPETVQTVDEFLQSLRQEVQGLRRDFEEEEQRRLAERRERELQLLAVEAQLQQVRAL